MTPTRHALTIVLAAAAVHGGRADTRFELEPGDHVTVVGNTFAERVALSGYFEALVHAAHPGRRIVVRQVPGSADEVGLRPREMNVPTMEDLLAAHEADAIVMCFGMSESFAGEDGLAAFERDLGALIDALRAAPGDDRPPPRLLLVSPIAHENLGPPLLAGPELDRRNRDLERYVDTMRRTAASRDVAFVDLLEPSRRLYAAIDRPLTSNGIHPDEHGCFHLVREIGASLGWIDADAAAPPDPAVDRLRRLAFDKHYHERLLYRATNTEYVWGRRAEPFGVVNFPPEMAQLERMIGARDEAMWDLELPEPAALFATAPDGPAIWETVPSSSDFPADRWDPPAVEAKGQENSLGSLDILDPDAFAASFTLPPDYRIECFASERDFPELANPLALTFDARGRLWVLCTPTYPHLVPGRAPECRLLILEDTDRDGRAERCRVWADRLYIPTGFAIDVDGVYVGQAPDLWKLTDSDGDDRADRREIVASGFGMPDSHHTISAFEWDPNGGIVLHEGVFTKSNVETPYGTRRTVDAAVWRFDPRTGRLAVLSHCSFANPWGHAFDDWGQSVLADASGGDNYAFAHVITAFEYPRKPARRDALLRRGRPTAGCELIASRHFPEDVQDSFLVNQSIGFHGTRWDRIRRAGSAWEAESMPQDLLQSSDVNFRPVAMEIGPDGALYIADWCNPLVGHMQYSVRDPRRDHEHGRIWRIRHATRPLLDPPRIEGAPIVELLELLRLPERNTRRHARRRLQTAPAAEVFPELTRWTGGLDRTDPLHDRLILETLWIHQAHGRVSLDLLDRVATLPEPRARAGAVRVLRHWMQARLVDPGDALPRLERAVADEDMAVRLEGVLACGFVPGPAGAALAAEAAGQPMDEGLRVVLDETLTHLARYGEPTTGVAWRLRLERTPVDALLALELDDVVAEVSLVRPDVPQAARIRALEFLAGEERGARAALLISALGAARRPGLALEAIAPLLLELSRDELAGAREELRALGEHPEIGLRHLAAAGRVVAGDDLGGLVAGDPERAVGVLGWLEPGAVPPVPPAALAPVLAELRGAVEAREIDPGAAIDQVTRHAPPGAAPDLFAWLGGLVDRGDEVGLGRFNGDHVIAMAALRAMNRVPTVRWPAGFERYRVAPAPPERLAAGRAVYADEIDGCLRCHGPDGRGEEGFPPLRRTPWVLGRPERAAAIVVHGLLGPIRLHDGRTFESVMEPLGAALDDGEVADVLTYVRQSFGNYAPAVEADDVRRARHLRGSGGRPWDVGALTRIFPLHRDRVLPLVPAGLTREPGGLPFGTFLGAVALQVGPAVGIVAVVLVMVAGRRKLAKGDADGS